MNMKRCPNCGSSNYDREIGCFFCRYPLDLKKSSETFINELVKFNNLILIMEYQDKKRREMMDKKYKKYKKSRYITIKKVSKRFHFWHRGV